MVGSVPPLKKCVALPQPGDGVVHPLRELIRHAGRGNGVNHWKYSSLQVVQNLLCLILAFLNGIQSRGFRRRGRCLRPPTSAAGGTAASSWFIVVSALSLPSGTVERISSASNTGTSGWTSDASNCATVDQSPAAGVLSRCSSENPNPSQDGDAEASSRSAPDTTWLSSDSPITTPPRRCRP